MSSIVVDIASMQVSDDPTVTIVTYALGSCIALALYDPSLRAGGMIHYMLPASSCSPERAAEKPAMFADIGIPLLFERMYALGCRKSDLRVFVAGGAQVQDQDNVFHIGKRNYAILRKMFWKNNIMITAEHVGGALSRTLSLDVGTGRIAVRVHGVETLLSGPSCSALGPTLRGDEP